MGKLVTLKSAAQLKHLIRFCVLYAFGYIKLSSANSFEYDNIIINLKKVQKEGSLIPFPGFESESWLVLCMTHLAEPFSSSYYHVAHAV